MILTIGGPPGSGTSTVATKLATDMGYSYVYAGRIFRDMAKEGGYSLEEFGRIAESDDHFDREVDNRMRDAAVDNSVVEGRMAAFVVNNADLKIWLDAPLDLRVSRISGRESLPESEIIKMTIDREKCEAHRYRSIYNVDIYDLTKYDIVINTQKWDSDGVFAILKSAITNLVWATQD